MCIQGLSVRSKLPRPIDTSLNPPHYCLPEIMHDGSGVDDKSNICVDGDDIVQP